MNTRVETSSSSSRIVNQQNPPSKIHKNILIAALVTSIALTALAIVVASTGLVIIPTFSISVNIFIFGSSAALSTIITVAEAIIYNMQFLSKNPFTPKDKSICLETPIIKKYDEYQVLDACYNLALKIRKEITNKDPNNTFCFSTPSILIALSMVLKGLKDNDKAFFFKTIGVENCSEDEFHETIHNLIKKLTIESESTQCSIANALTLLKDGESFSKNFVMNLEDKYNGKVFSGSEKESVVTEVNNFFSQKTNDMFNQVLNPSSNIDINFAIINSIYFKGLWEKSFDKDRITWENFVSCNQRSLKVDMLNDIRKLKYNEKNGIKMIEIPYKSINGKNFSFVAFLPSKDSDIDNFETSLNKETICEFRQKAQSQLVSLKLPKLEINTALGDMLDYLKKLGFSFEGGLENKPINSIIHNTKIKLDENGTEAAVFTQVASKGIHPTFIANRPFTFMIMIDDIALFQGSIRDQSALITAFDLPVSDDEETF